MQTEMSRGPLSSDELLAEKKVVLGSTFGRHHTIPFLPWSSSAFPLAFLSACHTEIHRKSLLLSDANANENANANAICF